ncbi:extensin-like [Helianthus annuus]|uniref:extensin-like n=1 Tax=Helianthus annuus TaxID=4232 RepID=UPI000B90279F|nr:extensin-like [Helianthus annuus]
MEPLKQPQPPPEPRRKCGARMSVRMGPWSSPLPPMPQTYPPIPEDPQMGGPSNTVPVVDPTPQTFVQPPPSGFDNPIPTYPDMTGYDPYMQAVIHNALYPSPYPPAYPTTRYPNYGYQYPAMPQPQPLPPPQIETLNQALERVKQLQRQAEKNEKKTSKIFKKLNKMYRGKKDE